MGSTNEKIIADLLDTYKANTPKSAKLNEKGAKYLPGGGTRNVAFYKPYPYFATHGKGDRIFDVDGKEYIDCLNNMTALLHGHAFPPIVEALQDQAAKGTVHAAPIEIQIQLAQKIVERVKSVDEVRFCNSGTEATMFALRAARVISNREKIIKFDGAYHGSHNYVEMNVIPDYMSKNPPQHNPEVGFPDVLKENILITVINDTEKLKEVIAANKNQVAAMIVEPVINKFGYAATSEYLKAARDLTEDNEIFLIFDEVITYRHDIGGMQQMLGVQPDFTAFGKIIGGGLPVGAFGGKKELMERFNPKNESYIGHSGTFSGNAMTMRAGIAALEHYQSTDVIKLNELSQRLEKGLQKVIDESKLPFNLQRIGSFVYVHTFKEQARSLLDYAQKLFPKYDMLPYFNLALLNEGLYVSKNPCLQFILSTVMTNKTIESIVEKFANAAELVKPLYE